MANTYNLNAGLAKKRSRPAERYSPGDLILLWIWRKTGWGSRISSRGVLLLELQRVLNANLKEEKLKCTKYTNLLKPIALNPHH